MFKRLLRRKRSLMKKILVNTDIMRQLLVQQEINNIRCNQRYQDPKNLLTYGYKVYSQNEEDGIIREIFNRIGVTNKVFVEFGVDPLENNTLALLFDGWKGLWIDAYEKYVNIIKNNYSDIIKSGQLKIVHSFVTKSNIDSTISSNMDYEEIDLLSVDIDGNDYYVLDAISCVNPRVIAIEYNAKFAPPILYCMDYDESHVFRHNDNFGVSLKFLEINLVKKGYRLVGCNITGVNAFFVREDLVLDKFQAPFTAENHYEPARYYLGGFSSGWTASYDALVKSQKMRID